MDNNNQSKPPLFLLAVMAILILVVIVYTIVQLATGAFLLLADGGWKWVLVVGGVLLVAFLIGHAKGDL